MNRSLWLIFGALALMAAAILLRYPSEKLAAARPGPEPEPSVRVEHELVALPPIARVSPRPEARRAARGDRAPTVSAAAPRTTDPQAPAPAVRAGRDRTMLEKARRAFVGNGRYRPEPFPRVRDN